MGYLNTIRNDYKENLNILFAGGDDVMAIGQWDDIIGFSDQAKAKFQRFIGNDKLTLSAGIALVPPTFPISKANLMADEALGVAKRNGRNSICLFDIPMTWAEWEVVKGLKKKLMDGLEPKIFSRGLLHALQIFHETKNAHLWDETGKAKPNKSFIWVSAYYISRYKERIKREHQGAHQFLEEMKGNFLPSLKENGRYYDLLAVAARWAEFEIRAKETKLVADNSTLTVNSQ